MFQVPPSDDTATLERPAPRKRGPKPATRIPEDFTANPHLQSWAAEKTPLVDWPAETGNFIDYWTAATKNDAKRDWDAAWRTWMRTAQERLADRGITRRWQPGSNDQGRASNELTRRPHPVAAPRSPADRVVADNRELYDRFAALEEGTRP